MTPPNIEVPTKLAATGPNLFRAGRILWAVATTSFGIASASVVMALVLADGRLGAPGPAQDKARLARLIAADDTITGAIGITVIDPCTGERRR